MSELAHYGIKGMRWGVRRTEAQLNKATKSSSRKKQQEPNDLEAARVVAGAIIKTAIPAALTATGAGAAVTLTATISIRILSEPAVKQKLNEVGRLVREATPDVGMSEIPKQKTKVSAKI